MAKRRYTDEQFIDAVRNSISWAQVFIKLDLKVGGSQYVQFKKLAKELNIDLSHMKGQGWSKGQKSHKPSKPLAEILIENSTYTNTNSLKKRLWNELVLEKKCLRCGSEEWFGEINHLQLDHIDGDRTNNLITNLRILCANCHSLTDTYCGKNMGK